MRTATVLLLMCAVLAGRAGATVLLPADLGDLSRDAYAIGRGSIVAVDSAVDVRRPPVHRDPRHAATPTPG